MNQTVAGSMERAVRDMYERLGEELTVADLARTASYSKFYFSRMFRELTGVSPARFRSVLRFQEARRLLATTTLEVAEISNRVGYGSLGTFGTRFKQAVGMTPTEFRRRGRIVNRATIARSESGVSGRAAGGVIRGWITTVPPEIRLGPVFVGLFADRVPHGPPVCIAQVLGPGLFVLRGVPPGTWFVHADALVRTPSPAHFELGDGPVGLIDRSGPLAVADGGAAEVETQLREMRPVDLPLLAAPFIVQPRPFAPTHRHRPKV